MQRLEVSGAIGAFRRQTVKAKMCKTDVKQGLGVYLKY